MKKIINILLILVLLVTMLPIRQVGNALFNNQWTEEINEHSENPIGKKLLISKWFFLSGDDQFSAGSCAHSKATARFIAFCQTLPAYPAGDIHSPPPNLLQ